jgi:hypothetical protein
MERSYEDFNDLYMHAYLPCPYWSPEFQFAESVAIDENVGKLFAYCGGATYGSSELKFRDTAKLFKQQGEGRTWANRSMHCDTTSNSPVHLTDHGCIGSISVCLSIDSRDIGLILVLSRNRLERMNFNVKKWLQAKTKCETQTQRKLWDEVMESVHLQCGTIREKYPVTTCSRTLQKIDDIARNDSSVGPVLHLKDFGHLNRGTLMHICKALLPNTTLKVIYTQGCAGMDDYVLIHGLCPVLVQRRIMAWNFGESPDITATGWAFLEKTLEETAVSFFYGEGNHMPPGMKARMIGTIKDPGVLGRNRKKYKQWNLELHPENSFAVMHTFLMWWNPKLAAPNVRFIQANKIASVLPDSTFTSKTAVVHINGG